MEYEKLHLLKKLRIRDKEKFDKLESSTKVVQHPMFKIIKGDIENWEIKV